MSTKSKAEFLLDKIKADAEEFAYRINPDDSFTLALAEGLMINEDRYGYMACPCRLASGVEEEDRDIICPCNYRDKDLVQYGTCFCGLYVSEEVFKGQKKFKPIPERRPEKEIRDRQEQGALLHDLKHPVWRCSVCGYLCARENPPGFCPICKAAYERFERFL